MGLMVSWGHCGQINSTVLGVQWKVIRQTWQNWLHCFSSTELQKGRLGDSLSNTIKQSTNRVQKPTANEDREKEFLDQILVSFQRGLVSRHLTEVCFKARGRETFERVSQCLRCRAYVCVCVYKYDIITHRLEITISHSCDLGRGGGPKMTSQSSVLSEEEVQDLSSLKMQPRLHPHHFGNHLNRCTSLWCGVSLSPSLKCEQWSGWW